MTMPGSAQKTTELLFSLLIVSLLPLYLYGGKVLFMLLVAGLTAFVCELVYHKLCMRRRRFRLDGGALVTAAACALLLSAGAPYWLVAAAVVFSLCVGKYPFGEKSQIFSPAAVGICLCSLCWPSACMSFPRPLTAVPLLGAPAVVVSSPEQQLLLGGAPYLSPTNSLLGLFAGPVGAGAVVVLAAVFVFLCVRRAVAPVPLLTALVVLLAGMLLFPRAAEAPLQLLLTELSSGVTLFGLVFLCPVSRFKAGGVLFGVLLGLLAIVFRHFGVNEYNFLFALLIAQACLPLCERAGGRLRGYLQGRRADADQA